MTPQRRPRLDVRTLLRSTLAGGAATLTDLAVLFVAVTVIGLSPRLASLPALLAGGVVNFFGNRHFAFRATSGSLKRQAALYTITEAIALALNGVLFDLAVRLVHPTTAGTMLLRLVTTNVVFLAFSYPVWRRVFRAPVATS
jgi:putative flippase GtrA